MDGEHEWLSQGLPVSTRVGPRGDGVCTVWVAGEIDLATAPSLEAALAEAEAGGAARVEVDLDGVKFLGLAGVHVLVTARRRLEAAGAELALVRAPPFPARVLRLAGWDR